MTLRVIVIVVVGVVAMVAFVGFEDNGKSNQIAELYVMNPDGSGIKRLTPELDRSVGGVRWSDNSKGLYFSYDNNGKKNVGYVTLSGKFSNKTDGLGGTTLGRPYTSGGFDVTSGGKIVFTESLGNRPADLAVISKRGSRFSPYMID